MAGEPGIGKTRLLREAEAYALRYGFRVLHGDAQRRRIAERYAPISEALAHHLYQQGPLQRRAIIRSFPWLVRLLPEFAGDLAEQLPTISRDGEPASLIGAAFAAPFFWPVLGGSWPGNEYGWGSIRLILSRRPHRVEHVLASLSVLLIAIGLALLACLAVGTLAGVAVSLLTGHAVFVSGVLTGTFALTLLKTFLVTWYGAAFIMILAFAAGTIFRSAPAGIGVGVGATLAQFLTIGILDGQTGFWKSVADHLPLRYVENLTGNVAASNFIHGTSLARVSPGAPSVGQSILALGLMIIGLLVVTCVAARNRDITA